MVVKEIEQEAQILLILLQYLIKDMMVVLVMVLPELTMVMVLVEVALAVRVLMEILLLHRGVLMVEMVV